jgi:hypothetical protein
MFPPAWFLPEALTLPRASRLHRKPENGFPVFPSLTFMEMRSVIAREDGLLGSCTPFIGDYYQGHEVTPEQ